jgi:5-methylthioribose kinase
MPKAGYAPLNADGIRSYLQALPVARERLGHDHAKWRVREVGDGNLNLVFIVEGAGAVVVKQALPYVRLVGESWPLPLKRSFFESNALFIQERYAPGLTPQIYHFDDRMALIVMEYLSPHIILRKGLMQRKLYPKAASTIAHFMAHTLFNTSMLASSAEAHKARIELFASNTALCKITEDLVFTDPYREAALNRWTAPYLDDIKAAFERDNPLKLAAQEKKWQFLTEAQALIHGDLHTGSVMVTAEDTRVIDPEFAFVGPMAFDVGAIIANYLLSFFSHRGQSVDGSPDSYCDWILEQTQVLWTVFEAEFTKLWMAQPSGETFAQGLFESADSAAALGLHRKVFMQRLFRDTLGFAGCKMIRRILGLAHVQDMESIEEPQIRARAETMALTFARLLLLQAHGFANIAAVTVAAQEHANAAKS